MNEGRYHWSYVYNTFQQMLKGKSQTVFFNTNCSGRLTQYLHRNFIKIDSINLKVWQNNEELLTSPYAPFLDIIRDYFKFLDKERIKEIFNKLQIYHFHRKLLYNYFTSGKTFNTHYKDNLTMDIHFKSNRIIADIYKLFRYVIDLFQKPAVIIISFGHEPNSSTLKLLKYISSRTKSSSKFLLVSILNIRLHHEPLESLETRHSDYTRKFTNYLLKNDLIFNMNFKGRSEKRRDTLPPAGIKEDIPYYMNRAITLYNLYAFYDSLKLLKQIYRLITDEETEVGTGPHLKTLRLLGDIYTYLNDNESALSFYNSYLNFAQQLNNTRAVSAANQRVGYIYFKKGKFERAEYFGKLSLKLAEESGDKNITFQALLLIFLTEDKQRKLPTKEWKAHYLDLIERARELKYSNVLLYLYSNPFGLYSEIDRDYEKMHNKGIILAAKYKNYYRLAIAYHTKSLFYSVKGDYPMSYEYLKKSQTIRERLNHKLDLSYIYNGIGFYLYLRGFYNIANQYYFKALGYLERVKNYHEIGMTLYNIATNGFLSFKYRLAINNLEHLLKLMKIFEMKGLTLHSRFGIYSLLAICYLKSGNFNKGYEYYTRIRVNRLKPLPKKNEEFFLFLLLNSLILSRQKKYARAEHYLRKSYFFLNMTNDVITYLKPRYYYEYSTLFARQNMKKSAQTYLQRGLKIASALKNSFYKNLLEKKISGRLNEFNYNFNLYNFNYKYIIESARIEKNLLNFESKVNQTNLLYNIQTILTRYSDRQELLDKLFSLINNNFLLDIIGYYSLREDSWEQLYTSGSSNEDLSPFMESLLKNGEKSRIVYKEEAETELPFDYSSFVIIPIYTNNRLSGSIFYATLNSEDRLTDNQLKLFSIVASQLSIALSKIEREEEIIQKNEKLTEYNNRLLLAATTDELTKVYNRKALYQKLEEEKNRLKRGTGREHSLCLLFLDLDNFKYFNDNFGHETGDQILIAFSKILKKSVRNFDFIARYGGDEFIIILTDSEYDDGALISRRILSSIKESNNFENLVEELINKKIEVSEENKLSCSIGIAHYDNEENISLLLANADRALYHAKKSGKNCYSIWSEVKDRLN